MSNRLINKIFVTVLILSLSSVCYAARGGKGKGGGTLQATDDLLELVGSTSTASFDLVDNDSGGKVSLQEFSLGTLSTWYTSRTGISLRANSNGQLEINLNQVYANLPIGESAREEFSYTAINHKGQTASAQIILNIQGRFQPDSTPDEDPPPPPPPEDDPLPPPPPEDDGVGACTEFNPTIDPSQFDHVLENFDQTTRLRLEGSQWDNTLVRNCHIHDVVGSSGIFLKDVKNVVITNCVISNVEKDGIKTSSTGHSENIQVIGNTITGTGGNGIHFPQRILDGVNPTNVIAANNSISDTGRSGDHGGYHGIYSQGQNVILSGNHVFGPRDGNGISFRSSGQISCNKVEGNSGDGKPGIRYFSDHTTGDPSLLVIEKNVVIGQSMGVHLYKPVQRYDGSSSYDHVVKSFIIRDNNISENDSALGIHETYTTDPIFSVEVDGNY